MKKCFALISALCLLSSVSCTNTSSESADYSYLLEVTTAPTRTDYFQYEYFDPTGLIINASTYDENNNLVETEAITDYTLTLQSTGETIDSNTVLDETGSFDISVSKDGYQSTSFTIAVTRVSNYREEIEIVSLPDINYQPGETFSSEGLSLMRNSTFFTINSGTQHLSSALTDYTLQIGDEEADGYKLPDEPSRLEVTIRATALNGQNISSEFAIYVLSQDISGPSEYPDDISLNDDNDSLTVHIDGFKDTKDTSDKGYYSPDEVELASTFYDYSFYCYNNWKFAPSYSKNEEVQHTPVLVVPVVVPTYERYATEANLETIKKVFFGSSVDMTFESLHSYYYKSSFGKLDITGTVTDYFYAADLSSAFSGSTIFESRVSTLAEECADWAKDAYNLDMKEYDSDSDGLIDAMWMIYIGPNSDQNTSYWAFSSTTGNKPDLEDPQINNYGWAGFDFLTTKSHQFRNEDAHVLIHETGHMLGLNDYYSYSYAGYDPLGGADMMDMNIGDHNGYSKMMLGWTKPYIAYGDCNITISNSMHENAIIVIPYDDKEYQTDANGKILFNPFDEYLVLEYYTPVDLNSLGYDLYGVDPVSGYGLRVYHVDNRLGHVDERGKWSFYEDPDDGIYDLTDNRSTIMANTEGSRFSTGYEESSYNGIPAYADNFDEIRWITADYTYLNSYRPASECAPLFGVGDEFSLSAYSSQFNFNGGFDCGKPFTSTFKVTEMTHI